MSKKYPLQYIMKKKKSKYSASLKDQLTLQRNFTQPIPSKTNAGRYYGLERSPCGLD